MLQNAWPFRDRIRETRRGLEPFRFICWWSSRCFTYFRYFSLSTSRCLEQFGNLFHIPRKTLEAFYEWILKPLDVSDRSSSTQRLLEQFRSFSKKTTHVSCNFASRKNKWRMLRTVSSFVSNNLQMSRTISRSLKTIGWMSQAVWSFLFKK